VTVALTRFVPVIVTAVPGGPLVGLNPEMVGGGGGMVNDWLVVTSPPEATTVSGPLVAPAGTPTVMLVPGGAPGLGMGPKRTALALSRLVPVIVTDVPTGPEAGLKPITVGGA
jgi:hypothetical protein